MEIDETIGEIMYRYVKSWLDFIFCLGAICICIYPMFFIFCTSYLLYKGNPIFIQNRIGYKEIEFELFKFRTMENEKSLGRFALFLRKSSLDELPQFFNILFGQMSFVGPRPLLPEYLALYTEEQKQRHLAKPGITGLAQISGGNALPWVKRLELDVHYVKEQSFVLDLKILIKTMFQFFIKSHEPHFSEKFKGE